MYEAERDYYVDNGCTTLFMRVQELGTFQVLAQAADENSYVVTKFAPSVRGLASRAAGVVTRHRRRCCGRCRCW